MITTWLFKKFPASTELEDSSQCSPATGPNLSQLNPLYFNNITILGEEWKL
jgi:hypothetical protein